MPSDFANMVAQAQMMQAPPDQQPEPKQPGILELIAQYVTNLLPGKEMFAPMNQQVLAGKQAYEDWGAQNRAMMEQVPGLGPALNLTENIANTPGAEFGIPMVGVMRATPKPMSGSANLNWGKMTPQEMEFKYISENYPPFMTEPIGTTFTGKSLKPKSQFLINEDVRNLDGFAMHNINERSFIQEVA